MILTLAEMERLRPVIGTLAHNRTFTARDLIDYTNFRPGMRGHGVGTLNALRLAGLLNRAGREWWPTCAGWRWIEGGE